MQAGAGDSFVTTASPHLSLFTMSQDLAGPWGHRDPAFEEFANQMSEQMMPALCGDEDSGDLELCDGISGRDSTRGLGVPKRAVQSAWRSPRMLLGCGGI